MHKACKKPSLPTWPGQRCMNPKTASVRHLHLALVSSVPILTAFLFAGAVVSFFTGVGEIFASQDQSPQSLHSAKTLGRTWDPVVVESSAFGGLFDGEEIGSLGLYAYTAQGFRSIPLQIDLIGEDGMVVPGYVNRVRKKGVYDFVPNKDRPTTLSCRYQVLFLAKDASMRYPLSEMPQGYAKACEIEIKDPVDGGTGWVYLMKPRESPPPKLTDDYVEYELIKKDSQNNEQIKAKYYVTGFPDADKPFAYGYWIIPTSAGGDGVDLLQTFRVRVRFNVLGMKFDLDPKNNIVPFVLSYNDGPIRATRRVLSNVVLGGLNMNWLAGDTRLETESQYYPRFFYFDGEVNLPGFVKKISKINAMFTTDFTPEATGFLWFNSTNAANGGCIVDCIMAPQESALRQEPYLWTILVGQQGGWGNILNMHAKGIRSNMELFYLDDAGYKDEKEPSIDGTWASTGYALNRIDQVEEKVRFRTYIFAIPRDFAVRDAQQLLHLVYDPLKVTVPRTFK